MRSHFRMILLSLLITGLSVFANGQQAVYALSSPCKSINGVTLSVIMGSTGYNYSGQFEIGETITFTHIGTIDQAIIEINGPQVASIAPGGSFIYTVSTPGINSVYVANNTSLGVATVAITCTAAPAVADDPNIEKLFTPGDGRINHHVADRAAPAAVYCLDGLMVLRIDPVTSQGTDEIRVTAEEIQAAGMPAEGNLILAQTDWAIVARLSDGRFSLNAWYADGKPYTIIWGECSLQSIEYVAR